MIMFKRRKKKCPSNFLGTIGDSIVAYAFVEFDHNAGYNNIYTITDDRHNVMILETREKIENADGEHYFLIKAKVKEHRQNIEQKQTVLTECTFELIDKYYKIHDEFFGEIGSNVEFSNVTARFRRTDENDFIVTGKEIKSMPVSEYRMIIEKGNHVFILPFDSRDKITSKTTGKYNIYAKVTGYTIEKGHRATFLYPTNIECKNGPFYGGGIKALIGIGRPWL